MSTDVDAVHLCSRLKHQEPTDEVGMSTDVKVGMKILEERI